VPCNDVTELLEVVLDNADHLRDYTFSKRTCGQGVGAASLLIDQLRGRPLDELLNKTAEAYLTEFPIPDELEEFLSLKHLFAIQGALEVYVGREAGGKADAFGDRVRRGRNDDSRADFGGHRHGENCVVRRLFVLRQSRGRASAERRTTCRARGRGGGSELDGDDVFVAADRADSRSA